MNLDFIQAAPTQRTKLADLDFVVTRELSKADVLVRQNSSIGSVTPHLKRIRHTHHRLARLVASGVRPVEISAQTGFSPGRISTLQNDPAFAELVVFYKENEIDAFFDDKEKLLALRSDIVEELQRRVDEDGESMSIGDLMTLFKAVGDRSGIAPANKTPQGGNTVNLNIGLLHQIDEHLAQVEAQKVKALPDDSK